MPQIPGPQRFRIPGLVQIIQFGDADLLPPFKLKKKKKILRLLNVKRYCGF